MDIRIKGLKGLITNGINELRIKGFRINRFINYMVELKY